MQLGSAQAAVPETRTSSEVQDGGGPSLVSGETKPSDRLRKSTRQLYRKLHFMKQRSFVMISGTGKNSMLSQADESTDSKALSSSS